MRILIIIAFGLMIFNCAHQNPIIVNEITVEELYDHVSFLASDSLKGRKPGTPEGDIAASYIHDHILKAGLQPLGEDGFQYFDVVTAVEAGPDNNLNFDGFTATLNEDFTPLAFSKDTSAQAELVFVDYGFAFEEDSVSWRTYE